MTIHQLPIYKFIVHRFPGPTWKSPFLPHRIHKQLEGKPVEVDEITAAKAALPIIEDALRRYSEQRQRGLKAAQVPQRLF